MDYEVRGFFAAPDNHPERLSENAIKTAITQASNQLSKNGISSIFDVVCIKKGTVIFSYFKARSETPEQIEGGRDEPSL
ncbi:MAG TPA: hypothetical protein VEB64_16570 [Azospirillaceae bacterium]|nr:hypothetical protein [Azospirillaceae bacterium]